MKITVRIQSRCTCSLGFTNDVGKGKLGREMGSELTVHYGLLPRANRGIFAINELPDLAGKIQVGLDRKSVV
jgi:magnesium chelatase subunit I